MANQVTFQIKIETIGGENVKNVTMDAEELGRVVKEVNQVSARLLLKSQNILLPIHFRKRQKGKLHRLCRIR